MEYCCSFIIFSKNTLLFSASKISAFFGAPDFEFIYVIKVQKTTTIPNNIKNLQYFFNLRQENRGLLRFFVFRNLQYSKNVSIYFKFYLFIYLLLRFTMNKFREKRRPAMELNLSAFILNYFLLK